MEINVEETLFDLKKYLERFIPGIINLRNNFDLNKGKDDLKTLSDGLEGLQWIMLALSHTKEYFYEGLTNEKLGSFNNVYEDMNNAMDNENYLKVVEIICDEIVPFLKEVEEKLDDRTVDDIQ